MQEFGEPMSLIFKAKKMKGDHNTAYLVWDLITNLSQYSIHHTKIDTIVWYNLILETDKLLPSTFLCSIDNTETVSHAQQTNPSPATGNVIQPRAALPPYNQYTSYKTKGSFSNIYILILKTILLAVAT
jgi:hypothetical protein